MSIVGEFSVDPRHDTVEFGRRDCPGGSGLPYRRFVSFFSQIGGEISARVLWGMSERIRAGLIRSALNFFPVK